MCVCVCVCVLICSIQTRQDPEAKELSKKQKIYHGRNMGKIKWAMQSLNKIIL